ncbi:hypothetical protein QAD02_001639 [Eretmocerus hayati]|uniref:Uncharacterized protein n=1 Tax=Eretmocerus hayati TaxID=131215 RepID=A0ACC2NLF8_9HYME|nr:hypothetical protein QAD02_001639 [Eretmocerus hayati]
MERQNCLLIQGEYVDNEISVLVKHHTVRCVGLKFNPDKLTSNSGFWRKLMFVDSFNSEYGPLTFFKFDSKFHQINLNLLKLLLHYSSGRLVNAELYGSTRSWIHVNRVTIGIFNTYKDMLDANAIPDKMHITHASTYTKCLCNQVLTDSVPIMLRSYEGEVELFGYQNNTYLTGTYGKFCDCPTVTYDELISDYFETLITEDHTVPWHIFIFRSLVGEVKGLVGQAAASFSSFVNKCFCLSLDIRGISSLECSLKRYFQAEIIREYKCDRCQERGRAVKRSCMYSAPRYLCLNLNRFDYFDNRKSKLCHEVEFGSHLNMTPFTIHRPDGVPEWSYELITVIAHMGNGAGEGHYVNYAQTSNGIFHYFNDDQDVTESDPLKASNIAYILIYKLVSPSILVGPMSNLKELNATNSEDPRHHEPASKATHSEEIGLFGIVPKVTGQPKEMAHGGRLYPRKRQEFPGKTASLQQGKTYISPPAPVEDELKDEEVERLLREGLPPLLDPPELWKLMEETERVWKLVVDGDPTWRAERDALFRYYNTLIETEEGFHKFSFITEKFVKAFNALRVKQLAKLRR